MKSTIEQIRRRFDNDVERFSNLETGQASWIDATVILDVLTEAAAAVNPKAKAVLDVGCGAGNYTLKLLERLPNLHVTLVDLSRPMLDRARERVSGATRGHLTLIQGDLREVPLGSEQFDIILAGAVLHHLRADPEWQAVFTRFHQALRPGGSLWIADSIEHALPEVEAAMRRRWGQHLTALKGEAYRDHVFGYVEEEDTPRSVIFQLDLLRAVGFRDVELLHKNNLFAAFGARKA